MADCCTDSDGLRVQDRDSLLHCPGSHSHICILTLTVTELFILRPLLGFTDHRVPELIPVLSSQPAGDVIHKPGGRLPLLSTRPAVTIEPIRGLLSIYSIYNL